MAETVLIIDDQANVRTLLKEYLTKQGYRVVQAQDGQQGLFVARHEQPDVVLLDVMMPNMDGFQFLTAFRKENQVPVIMVTARDEETDTVLGLELGADDYVVKPFSMRELNARIRANLRRQNPQVTSTEYLRSGGLVLNRATHDVLVNGKSVLLTPLEFDLLGILMRTPGRVYTRTELVDELSESGFTGLESTLNVHIRNIRLKIEEDPAKPEYLETVFGIGYRVNKKETD